MTRHACTRVVATLLAAALVVGAVAAPAAAGLPDPPDRPNEHGAKSGVGDVYDGSVFVIRTEDGTVTEKKQWKIPCGQERTVEVTHENEYGMSLSGPLGGAETSGVKQAAGDLRPEDQGSETMTKTVDLPPGDGEATLTHTAEYRHVDYEIYVQRQAVPAKNELVGYVHRKTLERTAWDLKDPCGGDGGGDPPVRPPGRWPKGPQPFVGPAGGGGGQPDEPRDGPQPVDGKYPFQSPRLPVDPSAVNPQSTEQSASGGGSGHADDGSELTGHGTADVAAILLSERFRSADVPGVAKGAIADKRVNVEVDGGTVGVRTDDEGTPVSVRTQPYGDPDATVTTDEATLRELERAENPGAAARTAIREGRVEYSTNNLVRQAAFYTAEAGLRGASVARTAARGVASFARGVSPGR